MRAAAPRSVAVGFFDGVHLGHRALLAGAEVALTFVNHPLAVLAPGREPALIMAVEERLAAIRATGVAEVIALEFTPALARLSPEEFLARHLKPLASPGGLCVRCGADWRFGRGGEGNAAWLRRHGVAVEEVPFASYRGGRVSSSRIRAALAAGEIADANAMLGRAYGFTAAAVPGKGVGRALGFATLNFPVKLPLRRGVWALTVDGAAGIGNYGCAPTMGDKAWPSPVLEAHLLGPWRDTAAPGAPRRVEFTAFVREERAFPDLAALKAQIAADCECREKMREPSENLPPGDGGLSALRRRSVL